MILKFKYGADICIDTAEIYNVYGITIDEDDGSCDFLDVHDGFSFLYLSLLSL